MHFTSSNILSVATIAFYSPAAVLTFFLCLRHGFSPNTGFIFLFLLSSIRISGAALNLASSHASSIQAANLNTSALVLSFTGIAPLILAALGLVSTVRLGMVKIYPTTIKSIHLFPLRVLVVVALVLCDEGAIEYGASVGASSPETSRIPITSRIGTIVFLVVSIATAIVTAVLFRFRCLFDDSGQYILYAVAVSLPFIAVRVLFGFLGAWTPNPDFSFLGGSVLLQGCVSIWPEMIVVIIYSGIGIISPRRPKLPDQPNESEQRKPDLRRTKIVLVKPWKVVDVEKTPTVITDELDGDQEQREGSSEGNLDYASIQARLGEDLQDRTQETFVPRATAIGERYLGIVTKDYLPPLTMIDSAIVLNKVLTS
ncbi:hypothetical protein ONS95_002100 [Cadophora gregata]|uniref:uncharacterized protein n=1 Tax=Cadophora gregata TaxID=51156 RepID=UPI0026DCF9F6|nr:uncharacterized protein ONS95_002100 [Cadophora gregata]KAK0109402.1 hypothetical protein ONS95_002100 [Cadophora gregata]